MPDVSPALLTDEQRQAIEFLLSDFEHSWRPDRLAEFAVALPTDGNLRLVALQELVQIDLERQWSAGRSVTLESYLEQFPELGDPRTVDRRLILAEWRARQLSGVLPNASEFAARFPLQVDQIRQERAEHRSSVDEADLRSTQSLRMTLSPFDTNLSTVANPPRTLTRELPPQLGPYRIVRHIGGGGMGDVYLAERVDIGLPVALKVPKLHVSAETELLERLMREARAVARIDHPNICKIYDIGQDAGIHFLAMQFVDGPTLEALLKQRADSPLLSTRGAVELVRKIALALAAAHARGVIHRDIKPSNILIDERRQEPVVTDFGLARPGGDDGLTYTQTGKVLGTLLYMSPEQADGRVGEIGVASDIYSLGITLYELLTGAVPFRSLQELFTKAAAAPSSIRKELSPELDRIVLKAIARKAADRYRSMEEFAADLQAWLTPSSKRPTPPRRTLVIALSLAALALLALGIVLTVQTKAGQVELRFANVDVQNLHLKIDDEAVDRTRIKMKHQGDEDWLTIDARPGKHELEISLPGFKLESRQVSVQAGKATPVEVTLLPLPKETPVSPDEKSGTTAESPPVVGEKTSEPPIGNKPEEKPAIPQPPVEDPAVAEEAARQRLTRSLVDHGWHYFDNLYPPGDLAIFRADGTWHKYRWKYWVVGPREIVISFNREAQSPEGGIRFSFNDELTAFTGEFTERNGRHHIIKGTRK
jgi:serine/threonine protein kinase